MQGVSRSRTLLFLSYRDSIARPEQSTSYPPKSRRNKGKQRAGRETEEEELSLLENSRHFAEEEGEDVDLEPVWSNISSQVDLILGVTLHKIERLERLHAKHLLPGFKDRTAEEKAIANLASEITKDFRNAHGLISRLGLSANSSTSTEAARLVQNVQTALATKLQSISSTFRKQQSTYLRQLNGQDADNISTRRHADAYLTVQDDVQLAQGSTTHESQSHVTSSRSKSQVDRRIQEINSLSESITQLADLFKDLSSLVIDQGTLLDRVDYNVEQLAVHMEGAVVELRKATEHQKRGGKLGCLFLLVLLVLAAVMLLVYRLSSR